MKLSMERLRPMALALVLALGAAKFLSSVWQGSPGKPRRPMRPPTSPVPSAAMKPGAATIPAYLDSLPADRRAALDQLLVVIRKNMPQGYEEAFAYGVIAWQVPLSVYPDTYNKRPMMYAALGSQKGHMALYLCNVYGDPETRAAFEARWAKSGKKLDMGKACVRFKKIEDVALDAVAEAIAATPMNKYVAFAKVVHAKKPATKQAKKAATRPAKKQAKKSARTPTTARTRRRWPPRRDRLMPRSSRRPARAPR
jgi:hypothetical protein